MALRRPLRPIAMGSLLSLISGVCAAQDRLANEPLTCPDVLVIESHPADAEWAFWGTGAALFPQGDATSWMAGAGAEMSFGLFRYGGFPLRHGIRYRDGEVRWGPWLSGGANGEGALVEAGLKLHAGGVRFAQWGTFDLRTGLGYNRMGQEPEPQWNAGLAWGLRTVVDRHQRRGYCDPPLQPQAFAEASLLRFVLTVRRGLGQAPASELALGLELSPTFVLPPAVCEHFVVH